MDTTESSASAHPSNDDHDDTVEAHYSSLERPCACTDGVVYVGHLVEDPGTGEEVEVVEAVPCRRCAGAMALFVIGWRPITLLLALAGYAIGAKLRDRL